MNITFGHISRVGIIILVILCGWSAMQLNGLKFEVKTSDYYPKGTEALLDNQKYTDHFLPDGDNTIMAIIAADNSVYDKSFLIKTSEFIRETEHLQGIKNTTSILDTKFPYYTKSRIWFIPILHWNDPDRYRSDSLKIIKNSLLTNQFISEDHQFICIYILLDDQRNSQYSSIFESIRAIGNQKNFKHVSLVGAKVLETSFGTLIVKELGYFGLLLLLIMVVLLSWIFRNTVVVLIILGIILSSILVSYGVLGYFNIRIEILSNILPILILVTSVNNSLHIFYKYKQVIQSKDVRVACIVTLSHKGKDVLFANLTTAFGFALLYFSLLPALSNLGLQASLVLLITFLVNAIWFLILLPNSFFYKLIRKSMKKEDAISFLIPQLYQRINNSKLLKVLVLVSITGVVLGTIFMERNNKMLKNIPKTENLHFGMRQLETDFGGVRKFNVMIVPKENNNAELEKLISITDTISNVLKTEKDISRILSLSTISCFLDETNIQSDMKMLKHAAINLGVFNNKHHSTRITANIKDIGRLETEKIRDRFIPIFRALSERHNFEFKFVGNDYLIDLAHKYRIQNMFNGLILSIGIISIIILFLFRSWKYFFLSLFANILPLLFAAGFMGWVGIELRGTTSILFTVGFAIAIDDTIHFISQYKRISANSNSSQIISLTIKSVGTPIFYSSLILGISFMVMILSEIWDLRMFGVLVSAFVFFAMFTDIIILPLLLSKWEKNG